MIALLEASRRVMSGGGVREILSPTTLMIGDRDRVGILANRGSGKSVIARLLSGIEPPDTGEVLRSGRISWPIGFAGMLHPDLSVAENIGLIAALAGEEAAELVAFCEGAGGLGPILHRPMKLATPAERATIGCCMSLGIACDTYIADDTIGFGQDLQRAMSETLLAQRLDTAGLVFLSSNPQQIQRFCDRTFVLLAGQLVPCDDLLAGQQALNACQALSPSPDQGDEDDRY